MNKLMGMIKSTSNTRPYGSLLDNRPDYMLPFGSRYRVIDITLSNFSENGITKVLLHGGENIRSTLDHVGTGRPWEMDKRHDGLVINAPTRHEFESRNSRITSYYNSLPFFEESSHEHIYIANPMVVSRIDISDAYREFLENDYDVMFLYRKQEDVENRYINSRKIIFDDQGKVQNIGLHLGTENIFNLFMDHVIIKKDVFKDIITMAQETDNANTLSEAVMENKDRLNIGAYEVKTHVEYIRDLQTYYQSNLNLLNEGIYTDLFLMGEGVLTKNKDEPSTLYKKGNNIENCIVANGCILEGEASGSVIFRGVKIGKNAIVKNSILFEGVVVEEGAIIVNAIVDKKAVIKKGVFVQSTVNNPYIVPKNQIME